MKSSWELERTGTRLSQQPRGLERWFPFSKVVSQLRLDWINGAVSAINGAVSAINGAVLVL